MAKGSRQNTNRLTEVFLCFVAQAPNSFQAPNQLFCVRAHYVPLNASDLSAGIVVYNSANNDSVHGLRVGTFQGPCASAPGPRVPRMHPYLARNSSSVGTRRGSCAWPPQLLSQS